MEYMSTKKSSGYVFYGIFIFFIDKNGITVYDKQMISR